MTGGCKLGLSIAQPRSGAARYESQLPSPEGQPLYTRLLILGLVEDLPIPGLASPGRLRAYGPPLTALENALQEFGKAASAATCKILFDYGIGATALQVAALGGPKGLALSAVGGVALYALEKNCEWDPDKPAPDGCQPNMCGCVEVEGGQGGKLAYKKPDGTWRYAETNTGGTVWGRKLLSVKCPPASGSVFTVVTWGTDDGPTTKEIRTPADCDQVCWYLVPGPGASCVNSCGGDTPPPQPDDYTHTTEDGCEINVEWLAWGVTPDGKYRPTFKMTPGASTRAGGGIIRQCNFAPTVYYDGGGQDGGGGGGGGTTIPWVDGDDDSGKPLWQDLLEKALPVALGNLTAQAIGALAGELLKAKLPPGEFNFVAPCNYKEDGTQESVIYQLPEQDYQSRVVSAQVVIMEMLQQHLNWKTPICFGNAKGAYARSITFQSDENTDAGNRRLTKRFGYRSDTPCDLEQLYEHWRCFTWNTGPVIVKHSGSPLGAPQVWAASVDEGKRVIQHAGREAGIDPDQTGEWSIGSSDNPRYGLSHQVKLMQVKGLWQATARQGPGGYADAVWTMPDLEVGAG